MSEPTSEAAPALLPLGLDAYLKLPTAPTTWLVENLIPSGGIVNLFSAPKVGKSYWCLDLARAISQGDSSWLGHTILAQERVLYLQLDTPRSLWHERFNLLKAAGVDFTTNEVTDEVTDSCSYLQMADLLQLPQSFDIMDDDHHTWLRTAIRQIKPALVIIDTLRELHSMDEDKATAMKQVLGRIETVRRPLPGDHVPAVLLITHSRKESPKYDGGLMQEGRGANYVAGRCDIVARLRAKDGADTCTMVHTGRATGHTVKALHRNPKTLLWELKEDPDAAAKEAWKLDIQANIKNPDYKKKTWAERGRLLNALHPNKKHDACVAALKRFKW